MHADIRWKEYVETMYAGVHEQENCCSLLKSFNIPRRLYPLLKKLAKIYSGGASNND